MVKKTKYSFSKTIKKTLKELLIWGLPQLSIYLLALYPIYANMSIAGIISIGVKALLDYLKHK